MVSWVELVTRTRERPTCIDKTEGLVYRMLGGNPSSRVSASFNIATGTCAPCPSNRDLNDTTATSNKE